MEKATRTAERLAKTTGDSYKTVIDYVVALQDRNVRFAQEIGDGSIKELRHQAENQRDAFQTLLEESVDAYVDLAYAPFAYFRQDLRLVENEMAGGFPIPNYDEM